jgi:hypothetical protein
VGGPGEEGERVVRMRREVGGEALEVP